MKTSRLLVGLWIVACSAGLAAEPTPSSAPPTAGGSSIPSAIDPADAPPELRGVLMIADERRFTLTTPGGTQCAWVAIGDSFNDWLVVRYREVDYTLVVSKEGVEVEVPMATAKILADDGSAKTTLAQAEALIEQMNFKAMFARMIEQQKKMAVSMTRQMVAKNPGPGVSADEMAAFQAKVMDIMWAEMNPEQMQADMARAYAEVFTPAELRGMAEFYATPAGAAMLEKSPELQQRMMQSMTPRLMAAMPRIKQMGEEFAAEQKRKQQQAVGAQSGHTETAPAP